MCFIHADWPCLGFRFTLVSVVCEMCLGRQEHLIAHWKFLRTHGLIQWDPLGFRVTIIAADQLWGQSLKAPTTTLVHQRAPVGLLSVVLIQLCISTGHVLVQVHRYPSSVELILIHACMSTGLVWVLLQRTLSSVGSRSSTLFSHVCPCFGSASSVLITLCP